MTNSNRYRHIIKIPHYNTFNYIYFNKCWSIFYYYLISFWSIQILNDQNFWENTISQTVSFKENLHLASTTQNH